MRPVSWLALRVPALYIDTGWELPKLQLHNDQDLRAYRRNFVATATNRALRACAAFKGDVLLVESEHDDLVPAEVIKSYRAALHADPLAHLPLHRGRRPRPVGRDEPARLHRATGAVALRDAPRRAPRSRHRTRDRGDGAAGPGGRAAGRAGGAGGAAEGCVKGTLARGRAASPRSSRDGPSRRSARAPPGCGRCGPNISQDVAQFSGSGPVRSWWPTIADPSAPPFVQLPQVVSLCGAKAVPSAREPVRMSCSFGVSPRPGCVINATCWRCGG